MLLFQIFDAIVRLVIVANLALALFILNVILKVVTIPVLLLGSRAYAKLNFFIYSTSVALLSFIWNGPNHMR